MRILLKRIARALRQWHSGHALMLLTWISSVCAILGCIASFVSIRMAEQAGRLETRIRHEDMRDAKFRAKLTAYAEYSSGSLRTLRLLVPELLERVEPSAVLAERRTYGLFTSYIYDVALGTAVAEYCVAQMHRPTHEDLVTAFRLKTELFRLQANELTLLQAVGIPALTVSDSAVRDAERVYELKGPFMTITPLPSTDLAVPIREALKAATRHPAGTMLRAPGARLGGGERFQFAFADDGEAATLDSVGVPGSVFMGRVRSGVGMAAQAYDLYFYPRAKW